VFGHWAPTTARSGSGIWRNVSRHRHNRCFGVRCLSRKGDPGSNGSGRERPYNKNWCFSGNQRPFRLSPHRWQRQISDSRSLGLTCAHIGAFSPDPFPLLLAHGITTIRNMGDGCSWDTDLTCIPDATEWRMLGSNARRLTPNVAESASYNFEDSISKEEAVRIVTRLK
jgi:hypothetical protein